MQEVSRRTVMGMAGVSAAMLGAGFPDFAEAASGKEGYTLPALPYSLNDLEPHLDPLTLKLHHDKHHAGYVKGLNNTLAALEKARQQGSHEHVRKLLRALSFHGSGHVLHTIYFSSLSPDPEKPKGALARAIKDQYDGVETLESELLAAARTVAGSGWAALVYEPLGKKLLVLQIEKHENQVFMGTIPILAVDVWEHAYYLKYQNRRGKYLEAVKKLLDWKEAGKRFDKARGYTP